MYFKARPIPKLDDEDKIRFLNKIEFSSNCWEWKASKTKKGYGDFYLKKSMFRAHRVSYELFRKEKIPLDRVLDHLCMNKSCVNPFHLEIVTQEENVRRSPYFISNVNRNKTKCSNGHEFNGDNLYQNFRKTTRVLGRDCKECKRNSARKFRAKERLKLLS